MLVSIVALLILGLASMAVSVILLYRQEEEPSPKINVKKIEIVDGGKSVAYTVVEKNGDEVVLVLQLRPIGKRGMVA